MPITSIYAGLLALFFVALSFRTISLRRRHKIAIGSAENEALMRAARAHANFAEYVPFALVLIGLLELADSSPVTLHAFGVALILGRLIHAYSVSRIDENTVFRVVGMVLTFTVLIGAAIRLLTVHGLQAM